MRSLRPLSLYPILTLSPYYKPEDDHQLYIRVFLQDLQDLCCLSEKRRIVIRLCAHLPRLTHILRRKAGENNFQQNFKFLNSLA